MQICNRLDCRKDMSFFLQNHISIHEWEMDTDMTKIMPDAYLKHPNTN